jgi:hypothetical protein
MGKQMERLLDSRTITIAGYVIRCPEGTVTYVAPDGVRYDLKPLADALAELILNQPRAA